MLIKKDTLLKINHSRKGIFVGIAIRDFDTTEEWYPVAVAMQKSVNGLNNVWEKGEEIPCRASFCEIMGVLA